MSEGQLSTDGGIEATGSPFQLRTSSIRNSTPFQSKSDTIFGSLGPIEQGYNSVVKSRDVDDDRVTIDEEDESGLEEIRRGCIFKKPKISSKEQSPLETKSSTDTRSVESKSSPNIDKDDGSEIIKSRTTDHESLSRRSVFRKPSGNFRQRRSGRGFEGAESSGRSQTPDHVLNPNKYTEYSLEETNMCGNSANRSVALGFLRELRKRKIEGDAEEETTDVKDKDKVIFKQPLSSGKEERRSNVKKRVYGSVCQMPEYEVGVKMPNKKPKLACSEDKQVSSEDEQSHSKTAFSPEHLEDDRPMGAKGQSNEDSTCTSQSEEASFKNRKGKGRRQFRGRQTEETE